MTDDKKAHEERAIAEISDRLQERFPDATAESVAAAIANARATFADAKVRDFVPVLIEKEAKAHLKGKR